MTLFLLACIAVGAFLVVAAALVGFSTLALAGSALRQLLASVRGSTRRSSGPPR